MTTEQPLIFIPLLFHILLVFYLYLKLGILKGKAIREKSVDRAAAALDNRVWPEAVIKVSNNIDNQFQIPMLFYALTFIAYLTENIDNFMLALMGCFVASRYLHTYIHISSNYVPYRFWSFAAGALLLLLITLLQFLLLIA
ncbi:hypothetical protein A3759_03740 [Thalassolituus sp. HI0120]|nr:hypothetical protein A3759_03740 [Thalassolituus sp. HI0120]